MVPPAVRLAASVAPDLEDLPPLDGDEEATDEEPFELEGAEEGVVDRDDATGEGDPVEMLTDEREESGLLEGVEGATVPLTVGVDVGEEVSTLGDDVEGADDSDAALAMDESSEMLDAGDEGPEAHEEQLGDLPPLEESGDDEAPDEAFFHESDFSPGQPTPTAWTATGAKNVDDPVERVFARSGQVFASVGGEIFLLDVEGGLSPAGGDLAPLDDEELLELSGYDVDSQAVSESGTFVLVRSRSDRGMGVFLKGRGEKLTKILDVEADLGLGAQASSIAWDAAHEVLWISGNFGVVAFRPSR